VGADAGWFCDKVVVRQVTDGESRMFYFPCGQWLDRGKSDGLIERTLLPREPPELAQEPSKLAEEPEPELDVRPSKGYEETTIDGGVIFSIAFSEICKMIDWLFDTLSSCKHLLHFFSIQNKLLLRLVVGCCRWSISLVS